MGLLFCDNFSKGKLGMVAGAWDLSTQAPKSHLFQDRERVVAATQDVLSIEALM